MKVPCSLVSQMSYYSIIVIFTYYNLIILLHFNAVTGWSEAYFENCIYSGSFTCLYEIKYIKSKGARYYVLKL